MCHCIGECPCSRASFAFSEIEDNAHLEIFDENEVLPVDILRQTFKERGGKSSD